MSQYHRNPAVRALLQLTPQEIQNFNHDQVIRKFGFRKLLTPQERILCQQKLQNLQKRLAQHERILQERKAHPSNLQGLPFTVGKHPAAFQQKIPEPVPVFVQQPSVFKNQPLLPATKGPFEAIDSNKYKQKPNNQTPPQATWRFLSILEPFSSLFRKPRIFHQKAKSSSELMVDEQRQALISGDQEDTRSSCKKSKQC